MIHTDAILATFTLQVQHHDNSTKKRLTLSEEMTPELSSLLQPYARVFDIPVDCHHSGHRITISLCFKELQQCKLGPIDTHIVKKNKLS